MDYIESLQRAQRGKLETSDHQASTGQRSRIPDILLNESIVSRYDLFSRYGVHGERAWPIQRTRDPRGLAGSSGLATTSLAFVTAFWVNKRISEFKVTYFFAF